MDWKAELKNQRRNFYFLASEKKLENLSKNWIHLPEKGQRSINFEFDFSHFWSRRKNFFNCFQKILQPPAPPSPQAPPAVGTRRRSHHATAAVQPTTYSALKTVSPQLQGMGNMFDFHKNSPKTTSFNFLRGAIQNNYISAVFLARTTAYYGYPYIMQK